MRAHGNDKLKKTGGFWLGFNSNFVAFSPKRSKQRGASAPQHAATGDRENLEEERVPLRLTLIPHGERVRKVLHDGMTLCC